MGDITKIDWDSCSRNLISADRDDLPSNIKAIKVESLDADALGRAANLIGGPVTSVQIEVDGPQNLIGFPHEYIEHYGSFQFEIAPVVFDQGMHKSTYEDITTTVAREFAQRIEEAENDDHKLRLVEWEHALLKMPEAAADVWPDSLRAMWVYGNGRFHQTEKEGFHRHGGFPDMIGNGRIVPGYFLNYTPSHDGTMFPGADGNLWFGKGGNYSLFTSDGHDHVDGCDHEVPQQFQSPIHGEKRATGVLSVYPTHDL